MLDDSIGDIPKQTWATALGGLEKTAWLRWTDGDKAREQSSPMVRFGKVRSTESRSVAELPRREAFVIFFAESA